MLTDPFQATACFMRLSGYLIETLRPNRVSVGFRPGEEQSV
jgi:hypothetical protein